MCFVNLVKALFMSPSWLTWAILIVPALVLVVGILATRHNGVGADDGASPVYGAAGAAWRRLGWLVMLSALACYALDAGLFCGGMTKTQNKAFEQNFIRQSSQAQGAAAMEDGFLEALDSVDEDELRQLLEDQGAGRRTGAERRAFLRQGDAVGEPMLKKALSRLPGMAGAKRREWLDSRHYTELLGDLSQSEWGTLLGTLAREGDVARTILTSLLADGELPAENRQKLWNAVMEKSDQTDWVRVAYAAGCAGQAALVKFFLASLGFLRGVLWLLLWLCVGLGMVLAGGTIVAESRDPLYGKFPA